LEITKVENRKDLKSFVLFPHRLYRGCPQYVPPLIRDDMETFNPKKNPVFDQAEAELYLVRQNGRIVGRVAAIISHAANEKYGRKNVRFGWFDVIDDFSVAETLLDAVRRWGRTKGMTSMTGPHGFSNYDPQGLLIDGFEHKNTIASLYNYPYYQDLIERYGMEKEVDYVEFRTLKPEGGLDPRYYRIKERLQERSQVRIERFSTRRQAVERGREIFALLNQAYADIYGVIPLTERHIDYLVKKFISFVDKNLISAAVAPDGELIGILVALPNLSEGFQKAGGRLFPFGWWHILRDMRRRDVLDFYLVAVKPEYQRTGVPVLMLLDLSQRAIEMGFSSSLSTTMLEDNILVQSLHKYFETYIHKKRRIYRMDISSDPVDADAAG
jgi:GNAT superfamily N-acetyltransferase